jgi:mono/diheme cytochrome c family protein
MGMKFDKPSTAGAFACLFLAGAAHAQGAPDPAMVQQGEALYVEQCAVCHQTTGAGRTPVFPELRGNEALADADFVVSKIHQGLGNMPAFPTLSATEITAIASYIGNAWGNAFGAPNEAEVEEILAEFDAPEELRTIWDGVYTKEQAEYGLTVYRAPCGICHGSRLNGVPDDNDMVPGPAIARVRFLQNWEGRSLGSLFTYTHSTMPLSNPGFLPPEDYAAILALMLDFSGVPPGDEELPADVWELSHIEIMREP